MQRLRRLTVRLLVAAGVVTWAIAMLLLKLTTRLALIGDWIIPEDRGKVGNCWIYALVEHHHRGGYIASRASHDISLFGRWSIPHAIFIEKLPPGTHVEFFSPHKRRSGDTVPFYVAWFEGKVFRSDPAGARMKRDRRQNDRRHEGERRCATKEPDTPT